MEQEQDLGAPAAADFTGCRTLAEMALREGWTPDRYAWALAENLRNSGMSLNLSRERLAALTTAAASADKAAADEIGRQYLIVEALLHRFALEATATLDRGGARADERAERLLSGALRAQRAGLACLSALKVLRSEGLAATGAPAAVQQSPRAEAD